MTDHAYLHRLTSLNFRVARVSSNVLLSDVSIEFLHQLRCFFNVRVAMLNSNELLSDIQIDFFLICSQSTSLEW